MKKLEKHVHSYVKMDPPFPGGDNYVHCRICGSAIAEQHTIGWADNLLEHDSHGNITKVKREDVNWDGWPKGDHFW